MTCQNPRPVKQEKIELFEIALANYAQKYGLTEEARRAFRFAKKPDDDAERL